MSEKCEKYTTVTVLCDGGSGLQADPLYLATKLATAGVEVK